MINNTKVKISLEYVKQFYEYHKGKVAVSFSGGKDSVVLLHLVRTLYPEVPAVFANTGLEYPEIVDFVKTTPNCEILRPKKSFKQVIEEYGYPVISKNVCRYVKDIKHSTDYMKNLRLHGSKKGNYGKLPVKWRFLIDAPFKISNACCYHLKKAPLNRYHAKTKRYFFVGERVSEGGVRKFNSKIFANKMKRCSPILNWTDEDVWDYIKSNKIPYSSIYDKGEVRTGCIFCGMGIAFDKGERFKRLKKLHPKLYDYMMNILGFKDVLDYIFKKLKWDKKYL